MQGKKALFVAKDLGSTNLVLPVAKKWRDGNGEYSVVVEGLAGKKFAEAGFIPFFQGTESFQKVPFTLDTSTTLDVLNPDVVVIGESAPINLEREFAIATKRKGTPLVVIDDLWGGFRRIGVIPDLVLTLDSLGLREVVENLPPHVQTSVVGNPGVPSAAEIEMLRGRIPEIKSEIPGAPIIGYVGGGKDSALEELVLLKECLKLTPKPWQLLVAFHPKWKDHIAIWREVLSGTEDLFYTSDLGIDGKDLVAVSHIVVAGISTLMTTAAALKKTVVCLSTPNVLSTVSQEAGLSEVPQVSLGLARAISRPTDLLSVKPAGLETLRELKPYDPELAYESICSFLR